MLRKTLGREHPRSFNILRSAASGFIRQTLKRSHPLYLEVTAVELVKVATKRRPPLDDSGRAARPLPESGDRSRGRHRLVDGAHVDGREDYWGTWEVKSDRISIGGSKAKGRVRDVRMLMVPVVLRIHRRTFEDKFRERTGKSRTVYDLRRSFAFILEAAGVVRSRRRAYLGHGAGDVTGLYELHDVAEYLAADAKKLREFIGIMENAPRLKLESGA